MRITKGLLSIVVNHPFSKEIHMFLRFLEFNNFQQSSLFFPLLGVVYTISVGREVKEIQQFDW